MIFQFLKYVQPTNYFNLKKYNGWFEYPKVSNISKDIIGDLDMDESYSTSAAKELDLSWQVINKGYLENTERLNSFPDLPLEDEYRFVRKYFQSVWVIYCLLIRIATFHNPFKEFRAFSNSKKFDKYTNENPLVNKGDLKAYDSKLIKSRPLVTVVIPTLNRYNHLEKVLRDFEKQTYNEFEIVVVDQSDDYNPEFYNMFDLNINLIRQQEKALWLARNTAIREAQGSFIALSEDDVRINENWIEEHLKCIDAFEADISAGVFYPEGGSIPKNRSFYAAAKQFATGNALLSKKVFEKVGLFDRQFEGQRMGDGEFGLRCYLENMKSVSNPFASCVDVKAPTGGLRELGSWDAFRPSKWFAPRPVPSVLYLYRKYFGAKLSIYALLKSIPPSIMPYRFKRNKKMLLVGVFISVLVLPLIGIQVVRSWSLSSEKLKEGPRIERL
ncbi:glycosyltransferase family 2 protein [Urechidicola vernalis]|uniref:Glycosyltransferase n=1 Tax=Urechidicola vernalis TaxID=3075600 RepID=A0ABU2Y229_9FLAO|nr:glycosyltransferase [Urechidicola sp. P050]MDT0552261.1 glycosyltransferase [Urechidicola sp. P050]